MERSKQDTVGDLYIPLVVDLDGTLIHTDFLLEGINDRLKKQPFSIFGMLADLLSGGKARLKANLAKQYDVAVADLPINHELVQWLKAEKKRGRRLVLATASHEKFAAKAAQYFGFFDEILATNSTINLKSTKKRNLLVEKFGEQGFDYIGDCHADKPVWKAARYAHVVSPGPILHNWIRAHAVPGKVFCHKEKKPFKAFFRALRPHQWAKNLLVFVPLFTAHLYTNPQAVWVCFLSFTVFSLMASSVYLLNDLVDIADDRHHPHKCKRPFASGQLSILVGWFACLIIFLLSFFVGLLMLPPLFMAILTVYYCLTMAYSFFLKKKPMADVMVLATLYTLRILAGTVVLGVSLSFWLLSFSMFIFLSLAVMKRVNELKLILSRNSSGQKLRGRGYRVEDLEFLVSMGNASGFLSIVLLALYVQSQYFSGHYAIPEIIWLLCPLMLFWIMRAWNMAHRGDMHDDPVLFALKDKTSWAVGGLILLILFLGKFFSGT